MSDGHELDGASLRNLDRFQDGLPPFYDHRMMYRYEYDEVTQQIVLREAGPRVVKPVSFKGLDAYGIGKAAA